MSVLDDMMRLGASRTNELIKNGTVRALGNNLDDYKDLWLPFRSAAQFIDSLVRLDPAPELYQLPYPPRDDIRPCRLLETNCFNYHLVEYETSARNWLAGNPDYVRLAMASGENKLRFERYNQQREKKVVRSAELLKDYTGNRLPPDVLAELSEMTQELSEMLKEFELIEDFSVFKPVE